MLPLLPPWDDHLYEQVEQARLDQEEEDYWEALMNDGPPQEEEK
jgi:hypothetical protein